MVNFNFSENRASRVFHLMMIIPAGLLLLLSIISMSTLSATNEKFLNEYDEEEPNGDSNCILNAKSGSSDNFYLVKFQKGDTCAFSVAGGGLLAAMGVGFIVVLVVKAFFGVRVVSVTALIELAMSAAGAVWALIVASVITAGLDITCSAFQQTFKDFKLDKFPCCSFFYLFNRDKLGDPSNVYFYEGINTSRITAWFVMVLLIIEAGVYTCIILRYFFGSKSSSKKSQKSSAEKADPI